MLLSVNLTPLYFPSSSNSKPSSQFPILRCRAGAVDLPAVPSFPPRSFHSQFPGSILDSEGVLIPREPDGVPASSEASRWSAAGVHKNSSKINAKEKNWSRDRESYLTDDSDALSLPMTYPDSSPVPPDEIDRRLACDPKFEDCKPMVYEWTGKCRSCQGSGYASYFNKRGKETFCRCITCLGVGYVQKITARTSVELMEDIDNGKPP